MTSTAKKAASPKPWSTRLMNSTVFWGSLLNVGAGTPWSHAQETALPSIEVEGSANPAAAIQVPAVTDKRIYAGKKSTKIKIDETPAIPTNNLRQISTKTPGLLVSEVNNESYASLNYRGQGDPHESFFLQILEDGLPLSADPYGYPAAYYLPTFDSIDSVEFVRGGASLLVGPQASGALNFNSRAPLKGRQFAGRARTLGGSFGLAQGYIEALGTVGDTGYVTGGHMRRSDGFREQNGDYSILGAHIKLEHQINDRTRLRLRGVTYQAQHGEPGGLAREAQAGYISFFDNARGTTSPSDRLEIDRNQLTLAVEHDLADQTQLELKLWAAGLKRSSFRQATGGTPEFGRIKTGATSTIQHHRFETYGVQMKAQGSWSLWERNHKWVAGLQHFESLSPFRQEHGAAPDARSGTLQQTIDRKTTARSLYAESIVDLPWLRVIPGLRMESINQSINETFRSFVGATRAANLKNEVGVGSLGLERDLSTASKVYANFATGYRPPMFADGMPLGQSQTVNADLREARSRTFEVGLAGQFGESSHYDLSVFDIHHSDQFGSVGANLQNIGATHYQGIEGLWISDLFREFNIRGGSRLEWTIGFSLLSAEIEKGASSLVGKTPQYAPGQIWRTSLNYRGAQGLELGLSGQYLGRHFADDANSANFQIAAFQIWDFSASLPTGIDDLKVQVMITNLFNTRYFARVRAAGIEPGQPLTASGGFSYVF